MRFDVVVAGAGPAGSSIAGLLGRAGAKVLLVDKAAFPREKPCGEGLLPHGAAVLRRIGAWPRAAEAGARFRGLRYGCGDISAQADFPRGGESGLAVCRERLDAALLGWALESSNVAFESGLFVQELLRDDEGRVVGLQARSSSGASARWGSALTVGADGLHSVVRRRAGVPVRWPAAGRFGATAHIEAAGAPAERVEVRLGAGFEAYLTPVPGGLSVALLFPASMLDRFSGEPGVRGRGFLALLAEAAGPERFAEARLSSAVRLWGPLGPSVDRACGPGFALLGDSAGAPDPIAGEGLSLALTTAERAAPLLLEAAARGGTAASLAPYEPLRRELSESAWALSKLLLFASRRPWLARRVVERLERRPELFARLLGIACGREPYRSLGWTDALQLVG